MFHHLLRSRQKGLIFFYVLKEIVFYVVAVFERNVRGIIKDIGLLPFMNIRSSRFYFNIIFLLYFAEAQYITVFVIIVIE